MPITINGSGTVTGVSVGGLPDGIVDTDILECSSNRQLKLLVQILVNTVAFSY